MALMIASRYLVCAIAWVHKKFRQQGIGSLLPRGKARTIRLDNVIRSSCYGEGVATCGLGVEMGLTQVSEGTNWRDGTSK
jgi:hypothetical protein